MLRIPSVPVKFFPQWRLCGRAARSTVTAGQSEADTEAKPFSAIPGPRSPLVSAVSAFRNRHRLHEFFRDRHARYGPIYKEWMGSKHTVFVATPEGAEQVFRQEGKFPSRPEMTVLKASRDHRSEGHGVGNLEGQAWYRARRVVNRPIMRIQSIAQHLATFHDVAQDFMDVLARKRDRQGVVPDLEKDLMYWSLESVSSMLYGRRLGCLKENLEPQIQNFVDATQYILRAMNVLFYIPANVVKVVLPRTWRTFVKQQDVIMDFSRLCIDKKIEELAARGEQREESEMGIIEYLISQPDFSRNDLYANITDVMGGGIDTTSHSTLYSLHQLAAHPELQERLLDDVTATLDPGKAPSFDKLQQLPLLKAIIKEILRLYPVAPSLFRNITDNAVVMGYHIPKNTMVAMSFYTMSTDESLFQDPLSFKPDRWLRGQGDKDVHPFSFTPFGFGPRMCLGRRVVEMEMQVLLSTIVRRFRLELVDPEPLKIKTVFLTVPSKPVRLRLLDR